MTDGVGSIAELWRYPVKSMLGERCPRVDAGERGLAGDRGWAVVDAETGKVVSAKRPKLWGAMLECSAAYVEEPPADGSAAPVQITLPDGGEVRSDDPDRDARLSEALGRPVTMESRAPEGATFDLRAADAAGLEVPEPERLTESPVGMFAPPGTFFDTSTLHVLATATLDSLSAAHPDGQWDVRRFRPNVVVALDDPPAEDFAENGWVGRVLELGESARASVLAPMPRCVMTTLPQPDLPRDPLILRTLAERNRHSLADAGVFACAGALANVAAPGPLAAGDRVGVGDG
ncbi:MAG TPA: MOSC N-terminal beta barrel domain-containing protein [Solirubrobacteraceae bacterium]|nr:MOSC N-terminal beta barrel domain-containing protein [Solirubrobacteraceae bacterium]